MRYAVVTVCLLILISGCIIVADGSRTRSSTDTTETPIYDQPASTPAQPRTASPRDDVNVSKLERRIHEQVNEARVERDLQPLVYDKRLAAIGKYHSWDMAQRSYFGHKDPNGTAHLERRKRFEYVCPHTGENIGYKRIYLPSGAFTNENLSLESLAREITHGWLNSTGHRENILSPHYEAEGVGVFVTQNGTIYVTQEFCG